MDGRKAAGQDCDYWPGVRPCPLLNYDDGDDDGDGDGGDDGDGDGDGDGVGNVDEE